MRVHLLTVACLLLLSACEPWKDITDGGSPQLGDMRCPASPDLGAPLARCAAAKGLSGDNLICVDFSSIPDGPLGNQPPDKLVNWNFTSLCPAGWEIANGKLQVKNFGMFTGTCSLTLPTTDLKQAQYQQYNSVTLSVIQRLDINDPNQTASMYLGLPIAARSLWDKTGKRERQQLMISMNRSDPVPMATNEVYQYLFQVVSGVMAGGTAQGWQIESIAVMANP